jgi:vitamin B12/bleomycin/antimicrobial peptide transport system ATP-binding/permease protein
VARLLETLAIIWRLAHPYFFSDDRWPGRALLAGVIAIELGLVGINVAINHWQNRFYNALQDRDWDIFVSELLHFSLLAACYVVAAAYQLYLQQWLQIRWRAWMTRRYLDHWLIGANHYRMQLLGEAADNPDQRIAEDIRLFGERAISIGVRVLGAAVSFVSFVVILWALSAQAPLQLFGYDISIPGYLVWAALIYATIGTLATHFIGRRLIGLNFFQQRYEADFRYNLVRVRENSEQIALLQGEAAENDRLRQRFSFVIANWWQIMVRLKRLTILTASYRQISAVFPYLVVSPAYFAGKMQLGGLMQTATAFDHVRESLSVFIDVYRDLAEWRAVIARLDGFDAAIAQAQAVAASSAVMIGVAADRQAVEIHDLLLRLPNGKPLVAGDSIVIEPRDSVLVSGPSGAGKSTLLRAVAGIWPFGTGRIVVPADARVLMLPQQPYFPVATLAAAVTYPAVAGTFSNQEISEGLIAVGLPDLVVRLDEEAHWNRTLSLGEQQRLAIARAIFQQPEFLFLDEATASLDEPAEASLYKLLQSRLPGATIVSIGHRAALGDFHKRRLMLVPDGDHRRLREQQIAAATT